MHLIEHTHIDHNTSLMSLSLPLPAGFMSKSIANVLLSVLKRMVPDSHYSFGVEKEKGGVREREWPHIVFPLLTAMDTFIITPEGQTPPTLGV